MPVEYWADALTFTTPGGTTHLPCGAVWSAERLSDTDLAVLSGLLAAAFRRVIAEGNRRDIAAGLVDDDDDQGDEDVAEAAAAEPPPRAVGFVAMMEREADRA